MTIGPDPMTSTLWMSLLFGMLFAPSGRGSGAWCRHAFPPRLARFARFARQSRRDARRTVFHELHEAVEEVGGVVRAGRGLGVVLHGVRGTVEALEPLDDVVVEAHVRDTDAAVCRVAVLVEGRVHGEAVVVGRHLDLAGRAVHDRLVDAAVAVLQLVRAEAEGATEQLVAEADAEERDAAVEHLTQQRDLALGGGRVSGTVGEEDAVRAGLPHRQDVVDRRGGRQHVHLDAALGHERRGHRLDAEVDGRDGEPRVADGRDGIRLGGGDLGGERGPGHLRARANRLEQLGLGALGGVTAEDADPHRPALAQVAGQGARVDVADADDALVDELVLEVARGAPVRRPDGGVAHDVAGDPDAAALVVLGVDARVADVRRGHDDDLPVVARVGQRLLVARHAGGEDGLADGLPQCTVGRPVEGAAVLEHEGRRHAGACGPPVTGGHGQGGLGGHRSAPEVVAFVSSRRVPAPLRTSWVTRPAWTVARTAPCRVRTCHGLLRERLRLAAASTVTSRSGSTRVMLAGLPTSSALPWWASPPIRAGAVDMTRATSAQSSRPGRTSTSLTTESAVSRPSMPKAASTKACSLSWRAWGAWSVATASMVPSARAARRASTSSVGRSGGLTL